jgi:hypothetical protein
MSLRFGNWEVPDTSLSLTLRPRAVAEQDVLSIVDEAYLLHMEYGERSILSGSDAKLL